MANEKRGMFIVTEKPTVQFPLGRSVTHEEARRLLQSIYYPAPARSRRRKSTRRPEPVRAH